jgi:hypothetical protein
MKQLRRRWQHDTHVATGQIPARAPSLRAGVTNLFDNTDRVTGRSSQSSKTIFVIDDR